jgi:hypothetical protein
VGGVAGKVIEPKRAKPPVDEEKLEAAMQREKEKIAAAKVPPHPHTHLMRSRSTRTEFLLLRLRRCVRGERPR